MKITTKTTKEQLKNILGANAKAVKTADKALFDRIAYADKMAKKDDSKVSRKDLVDLVKEVITLLGDKLVVPALAEETPAKPVAENSVKKLGKSSSKSKKTAETEETAEEPKEEPKAEPKKPVAKAKKSSKKSEDGVTESSKKTVQNKAFVLAEVFPETFELEGQKYELASDIANMGQLYDALEKDESLVFAMYWTKRHIKQFGYGVETLKAPKEFPMDLDLATCIHVSEECIVAYAISMYTEACYMYLPNDIEEVEGIRYANGVEFQIYRMVD